MRKLPALLLFLGLSLPGWSDTIIDGPVGRGGLPVSESQSVAVSWTISSGFSQVSIAVPLWTAGLGLSGTGTAYLASSVPDSQIQSTQFMFPSTPASGPIPSPQFVELFNSLTLSPGTYYLTLMSTDPTSLQNWMNVLTPSAVETASGVTLGGTYLGFPADGPYLGQELSDSGFRDTTAFGSAGLQIFGDPAGDPIAAAPEPPTYALLLGVTLLAVATLRKRSFA
jgi:hypothetical protein